MNHKGYHFYIAVGLLILSFVSCAMAEQDNTLYPAKEGWNYGYIHNDGRWAIPPEKFTMVYPFQPSQLAPVQTEMKNLWRNDEPFQMIDRTGNTVVLLEEWALDMDYVGTNYNIQKPIMVGNANILVNRNDYWRSALYMSNTGELIELTPDTLGYSPSPDACPLTEKDAENHYYDPYCITIQQWQDHYVLGFLYTEKTYFHDEYIQAFVILDENGHKLHDNIFIIDYDLLNDSDIITAPCLLFKQEDSYACVDPDGSILTSGFPEGSWLTYGDDAIHLPEGAGYYILETGETVDERNYAMYRAKNNPCGIAVFNDTYVNTQGETMNWSSLSFDEYIYPYDFNKDGIAWVGSYFFDKYILIDTEGNPITKEPVYGYYCARTEESFTDDERNHPFSGGWEAISQTEITRDMPDCLNYINQKGEFLFEHACLYEADPFSGDLARIVVLMEDRTPVEAYIDTTGHVVWAENDRRDEVEQRLHSGKPFSLNPLTTERIKQMLVGEWEVFATCNESTGSMQFREDFTTENPDVFWRVEEDRNPDNEYVFVLVMERNGKEYRNGIGFLSADYLIVYNDDCCDEAFLRMAPGYCAENDN